MGSLRYSTEGKITQSTEEDRYLVAIEVARTFRSLRQLYDRVSCSFPSCDENTVVFNLVHGNKSSVIFNQELTIFW